MRLLSRLRTQKPAISEAEVSEIQERVRAMRAQVGQRDVELADLFALLGEDERPAMREMREVQRPSVERLWPDQIPSARGAAGEPAGQSPRVPDPWNQMRGSSLPTTH